VIREGKTTGEQLIAIVTNMCSEEQTAVIEHLIQLLVSEIPDITSIFHGEHSGSASAVVWEKITKRYGADYIREYIGRYIFRIECGTFFQTNSRQVQRLYDIVKKAGRFTGTETVYDLYSGIGTIPIYLSDAVKLVIGMELEPVSAEAARKNAELNAISNCEFVQGKVRSLIKYAPLLFNKFGKPDVVIDPKTVKRVIRLGARRIIYISCNPATLARDLNTIKEQYTIESVVPVDMFPHTAHIESVTTLVRRDM
jgi:23S rRNA (uracil1939-C5)-methyltransferase